MPSKISVRDAMLAFDNCAKYGFDKDIGQTNAFMRGVDDGHNAYADRPNSETRYRQRVADAFNMDLPYKRGFCFGASVVELENMERKES